MTVELDYLEPRCLCGDCLVTDCLRNACYKKPHVGSEKYMKYMEEYIEAHNPV